MTALLAHGDPVSHAAFAAAGVASVVWAARRAERVGASLRRPVLFAVGVSTTLAALSPPMEAVAARTYTGHMVQHLALILVAAPCLALGWPHRPGATGHRRRIPVAPRRSLRALAPLLASGAFAVVLTATHLTAWYQDALEHQVVHDLEHAAYLASAVALWYALARLRGASPAARVVAAFGVIASTGLVGAVLLTADTPLVDAYVQRLGAPDALVDQRTAAALMWTTGIMTALPLLVAAVWRWALAEQRRTERLEALAAPGPDPDATSDPITRRPAPGAQASRAAS